MADPILSPTQMLQQPDPAAERLKRQRSLATVGTLMGLEPTMAVGQMLMKDATERAEAGKANKRKYLGQGFIMEPDGSVTRDQGMADAELEREARLLSRMGYQNDLITGRPKTQLVPAEGGYQPITTTTTTGGGATATPGQVVPVTAPATKPAAADLEQAREARRLQREAQELAAEVAKYPGAISGTKSTVQDVIGKTPIVGSAAASAAGERMYTPEQRAILTRGAAFEQDLSNLAAGLALTGFEIEQRNRWSPFVPGISAAETQRRLKNIDERFGRKADVYAPGATAAPNAAPPQGGAVEWERGPDGRPRRKQ